MVALLSVVVPMDYEQDAPRPFAPRPRPVPDGLGARYEVVAVGDGSTDRTAALLDAVAFVAGATVPNWISRSVTVLCCTPCTATATCAGCSPTPAPARFGRDCGTSAARRRSTG